MADAAPSRAEVQKVRLRALRALDRAGLDLAGVGLTLTSEAYVLGLRARIEALEEESRAAWATLNRTRGELIDCQRELLGVRRG